MRGCMKYVLKHREKPNMNTAFPQKTGTLPRCLATCLVFLGWFTVPMLFLGQDELFLKWMFPKIVVPQNGW